MPEDEYVWLPREDILHFEEISALVDVFIGLGVDKVRLTGGEPLLRRDLPTLVRLLADKPDLKDLALTTNGILLGDQIDALAAAGLRRVTVSLDTLRPDRFTRLTRVDALAQVREGLTAAQRVFASPPLNEMAPVPPRGGTAQVDARLFKIDTVVIRDVNDDEMADLIEFAKSLGAELRFIEYMDVGGATRWSPDRVVGRREMIATLTRRYGSIEPIIEHSSAPAERFALPDGTTFGIISSTTEPFCRSCDRSRLTADGMWYLCLYATQGIDLRGPMRRQPSSIELAGLIKSAWLSRADRGAEERLQFGDRQAFVPVRLLKKDPHLEMHTRGG